jgi:hypothetical protein
LAVEGEPLEVRRDGGVTVAKQLATWFGVFCGAMSIFLLGILIARKPFGIQITSAVAYTLWLFFNLFCDSRAYKGYSLRLGAVQRKLPTLLVIHAAFLLTVIVGLTYALSLRPRLAGTWYAAGKYRDDNFALVVIVTGVAISMIQVYISRNILRRSVDADR